MTKVDMWESIKAVNGLSDKQVAFLEHEIELLNKKSQAIRKPTPRQVENETTKDKIVGEMNAGIDYTITDINKNFACAKDLSSQKVSALVSQLVAENRLVRTEKGKSATFSLPLAG